MIALLLLLLATCPVTSQIHFSPTWGTGKRSDRERAPHPTPDASSDSCWAQSDLRIVFQLAQMIKVSENNALFPVSVMTIVMITMMMERTMMIVTATATATMAMTSMILTATNDDRGIDDDGDGCGGDDGAGDRSDFDDDVDDCENDDHENDDGYNNGVDNYDYGHDLNDETRDRFSFDLMTFVVLQNKTKSH